MTNKRLILLGVVTALAMAGGQAYAATCSTETVTFLRTHPGFTCTDADGDLMFSAFTFAAATNGAAQVSFPSDDAIMVSHPGSNLGTSSTNILHYTVTGENGILLTDVTLANVTGGTALGTLTTTFAGGGLNFNATQATSPQTRTFAGSGMPSATTTNSFSRTTVVGLGRNLTSLTNTYSHNAAEPEPPPAEVPEPMSLSLFGLGLAGLALATRRRS